MLTGYLVKFKDVWQSLNSNSLVNFCTFFSLTDQGRYFCKNVDPDEMAHNEPSYMDLHCLLPSVTCSLRLE